MTRLNCTSMRSSGTTAIPYVALLAGIGVAATLGAQEGESPKEAFERVVAAESVKKLENSEIEWKETGFGRAGPVAVGKNARSMQDVSVKYVGDLLPLLDKDETFIVAHVLLTRLWRVSRSEKEHICIPHSVTARSVQSA